MSRRLFLGFFGLIVVSIGAFATDLPSRWRSWRYSRAIETGSHVSPVFCRVQLPIEVFPHVHNQLADLRIIDEGGAEVPYAMSAESGGTKTELRRAALRENSYVPGQYTQVLLDLGTQPSFHNAVKIVTTASDFMDWVEVAASDDTRVWRVVRGRAPISRLRQENLEGNQAIRYSQTNARYLRLRIFEGSHLFPVSSAEVSFEKEIAEPPREAIPVNLMLDSSAPASVTRWHADFDSALYPVREIAFRTSQAEFFRTVRVETSEDATEWMFFTSGDIYRHGVGPTLEESLRVSLHAIYGAGIPRYWRVEMLNQNDAPLESVAANFLVISRLVYFQSKAGHSYRLLYGNDQVAAASYDLQRVLDLEPKAKSQMVQAEVGPEELTANYSDPRPFTERHPNVLWIALAAGVVLLAYAALRALRPAAPKP